MKLTASQAEAVSLRDCNLLISASAGSGKTEVLARRCVALVADPSRPCDIDRLLVVTFTRAAASELRSRVARALRKEFAAAKTRAVRDHLRRQMALIPAADICTLDSWAGRLVRDHFAAAGIDPAFATMSGEDAGLLQSEILDELFEAVYTGRHGLAEAVTRWVGRHSRPDDGFLRGLVTELGAFRGRLVSPKSWFERMVRFHTQTAGEITAQSKAILADALGRECAFQSGQVSGVLAAAGLDAAVAGALRTYRESLESWRGRLDAETENLSAVLAEIAAFALYPKRGKNSPATPLLLEQIADKWIKRRLRERWDAETIESMISHSADSSALVAVLLSLTQAFLNRLDEVKTQRACYEFGDIERRALDLLGGAECDGPRRPTPIALGLQERYEHVLIDEYQDTSPVQVEMLRLVTRRADADGGRRGNRFMVGDVKQSIYGFRQAEPKLFSEQLNAFENDSAAGRNVFLSDNFRSHAAVLAGLNAVFGMIFHSDLGGSRYGERERLTARRGELPNPSLDGAPRVELQLFDSGVVERSGESDAAESIDAESSGTQDMEKVESEALLAAGQIRELIHNRTPILGCDASGSPVLRPVALSDIVVLLRSANVNAGRVARVFRQEGLDCVTSGRESILDSMEVTDIRNALALMVNRGRDIEMAAYLRSPMVGLSADELLEMRQFQPKGSYSAAVQAFVAQRREHELAVKVGAALKRLDGWSVAARKMELPALLRRIYRDTGLVLLARGMIGGKHRVEMLRALLRYAADFAAAGRNGVGEFLAYLDELGKQEIAPESPVAAGDAAVRIMTIHASKGLEFPIVFLLGAGSKFNDRRSKAALQLDATHGLGLSFLDYRARACLTSPQHQVIRFAAGHRDMEEEMRLLYVAATRARDKLIVIGHCKRETWTTIVDTCRDVPGPPSLVSLLGCGSMMEWLLWGVAAARANAAGPISSGAQPDGAALVRVVNGADSVDAPRALSSSATPATSDENAAGASGREAADGGLQAWALEDDAWVRRSVQLINGRIDDSLAQLPAALSVSGMKQRLARRAAADRGRETGKRAAPDGGRGGFRMLRGPDLAGGASEREADEADRESIFALDAGTALHRFMQFCDAGRLGAKSDIERQIAEMMAARRLSAAEAELIAADDVVWFSGTAEGRLFATQLGGCRREVPFTFAMPAEWLIRKPAAAVADSMVRIIGEESIIVRGIIDCLIDTPAGLVLFDYKTDAIRDEAMWVERVAAYEPQLRTYVAAASAIFARPVARAALIFVRARRVAQVSTESPRLEIFDFPV